jgi:hypothetical protein
MLFGYVLCALRFFSLRCCCDMHNALLLLLFFDRVYVSCLKVYVCFYLFQNCSYLSLKKKFFFGVKNEFFFRSYLCMCWIFFWNWNVRFLTFPMSSFDINFKVFVCEDNFCRGNDLSPSLLHSVSNTVLVFSQTHYPHMPPSSYT